MSNVFCGFTALGTYGAVGASFLIVNSNTTNLSFTLGTTTRKRIAVIAGNRVGRYGAGCTRNNVYSMACTPSAFRGRVHSALIYNTNGYSRRTIKLIIHQTPRLVQSLVR